MTEQRSGGGARSIRQRGDRPSENELADQAGGRGGSGSALRLRQGGVGVRGPARARLRAPAPELFAFGQTPLRQKSLRPPPLDNHHPPPLLRQLSPRGRAALQNGEQRARKGAPDLPLPCTRACRPSCGEFADVTVAGRRVLPSARDPLGNCTSAVVTFYGM